MPDESAANPQILMSQLLFGKQLTYCLSGVAWLGVADQMSVTPMPIEEIAAKTGAHAPSLYRVMRLLAAMGVFKEERGKRFALTQAGELLKSDAPGTLRYFAMMFGDEWTTRAYEHFADCLRTGQDGVTQAYGKPVFDLLAERPDLSDTFQAAMTSSSSMAGKVISAAYDFGGIERLADVGGGHGALLAAILRRNPKTHGVLFDRPEIVAGVPDDQFAGCEDRVEIEGGSFFERVPEGCDAYIMKHIIHDWSDEHCRTILELMREKLPKHGRVLVCDMVVSGEPGPTPAKLLDIEMLVMTIGGKERTEEEFSELFASAGLRLNRIVPTERPICVIEAVPD
ncbi:MAG: methyltransferase [Methyloceanibacter sp.]